MIRARRDRTDYVVGIAKDDPQEASDIADVKGRTPTTSPVYAGSRRWRNYE